MSRRCLSIFLRPRPTARFAAPVVDANRCVWFEYDTSPPTPIIHGIKPVEIRVSFFASGNAYICEYEHLMWLIQHHHVAMPQPECDILWGNIGGVGVAPRLDEMYVEGTNDRQ